MITVTCSNADPFEIATVCDVADVKTISYRRPPLYSHLSKRHFVHPVLAGFVFRGVRLLCLDSSVFVDHVHGLLHVIFRRYRVIGAFISSSFLQVIPVDVETLSRELEKLVQPPRLWLVSRVSRIKVIFAKIKDIKSQLQLP